MNLKNRMSQFFQELEANNNVSDMMKVMRLLEQTCNELIRENSSLQRENNEYKRMLNLPPDNPTYTN